MKKILLLIFTVCNIGILKAESSITSQIPDKIKFKGKEYLLNSNPLEAYFEKFPDKRPKSDIMSTALWRGYVAYFEIIDQQLYVTDIKIQIPNEEPEKEHRYKWASVFKNVFPNKSKMKIDWYTGILILPHGKMIEYVHMGYASTYEKYWLLEVEKGNFNEARYYTNKQFVQFKKTQFQQFKKTKEYKKLYTELQERNNYENNFIESFIKDFVTNYTTKFLSK